MQGPWTHFFSVVRMEHSKSTCGDFGYSDRQLLVSTVRLISSESFRHLSWIIRIEHKTDLNVLALGESGSGLTVLKAKVENGLQNVHIVRELRLGVSMTSEREECGGLRAVS